MKIYTGGGDQGTTSLFSGERVAKSDRRLAAYGTVDELNSVLGAVAALLPPEGLALLPELQRIQGELFQLGAWLAVTPGSTAAGHLHPFNEEAAKRLEAAIDVLESELAPLRSFILPGGHPAAAWAQVARTVCRRAERRAVALMTETAEPQCDSQRPSGILVYLNRLSDYLFVLARRLNQLTGVAEQPWVCS